MRLNYIETLSFSVFHSDKGIFETNPKINNISLIEGEDTNPAKNM